MGPDVTTREVIQGGIILLLGVLAVVESWWCW
jgi:hypothetical protein